MTKTEQGKCPFPGGARVNNRALTRQFGETGFQPSPNLKEGESLKDAYDREPLLYIQDAYALIANIAPSVLNRVLDQRDERGPFGLVKRLQGTEQYAVVTGLRYDRPFIDVDAYLGDTFDKSLQDTIADQELRGDNPVLDSNISGLQELCGFKGIDPAALIQSGFGTSRRYMTKALEMMPKVVKRDLGTSDPSRVETIASDSYSSLILPVASGNKEIVTKVIHELQGGNNKRDSQFSPIDFTVKSDPHSQKERVWFSDSFISEFKQRHGVWIPDYVGSRPTISCAVLYSEAIKDMWNWSIDIGKQIWEAEQRRILAA